MQEPIIFAVQVIGEVDDDSLSMHNVALDTTAEDFIAAIAEGAG